MIVLHVLTRDRKLCRSAAVDGCRPAVVEVDSLAVVVEPEWTVSAQPSQSVRVLTRLAEELGRGTLAVAPAPTGRSSSAVVMVS